jgi:hypothetical protein
VWACLAASNNSEPKFIAPFVAPQLCGDHIAHIVIDDAVVAPGHSGKNAGTRKAQGNQR